MPEDDASEEKGALSISRFKTMDVVTDAAACDHGVGLGRWGSGNGGSESWLAGSSEAILF
jgi:hypothetical protein